MKIHDLATNKFISIIIREKDKFKDGMRTFFENSKQEGCETKEAFQHMQKYLRGEELTEEENTAFKEQMGDLLKCIGIVIPFAIIPVLQY